MLYGEGSEDMARFVGYHKSAYPPGEKYFSGDATLLAKFCMVRYMMLVNIILGICF